MTNRAKATSVNRSGKSFTQLRSTQAQYLPTVNFRSAINEWILRRSSANSYKIRHEILVFLYSNRWGVWGIPPPPPLRLQKIVKSRGSEMLLSIFRGIFLQKSQYWAKSRRGNCLVLPHANYDSASPNPTHSISKREVNEVPGTCRTCHHLDQS